MTAFVLLILALVPLVGTWLLIRERGGRGEKGQAASLARAGLLEAQNLLEPERKIEVVREEERKRDLLVDVREEGEKGP